MLCCVHIYDMLNESNPPLKDKYYSTYGMYLYTQIKS